MTVVGVNLLLLAEVPRHLIVYPSLWSVSWVDLEEKLGELSTA